MPAGYPSYKRTLKEGDLQNAIGPRPKGGSQYRIYDPDVHLTYYHGTRAGQLYAERTHNGHRFRAEFDPFEYHRAGIDALYRDAEEFNRRFDAFLGNGKLGADDLAVALEQQGFTVKVFAKKEQPAPFKMEDPRPEQEPEVVLLRRVEPRHRFPLRGEVHVYDDHHEFVDESGNVYVLKQD